MANNSIPKTNTGNQEWGTPDYFIESTRKVMGSISCDPASNAVSQQVIQADTFYTVQDNSLNHDWKGTVWMNPPYGPTKAIPLGFVNKLIVEVTLRHCDQFIVLMPSSTETEWFKRIFRLSDAVMFTNVRTKFIDLVPTGKKRSGPPGGSTVFYYGSNKTAFIDEFKQYGYFVQEVYP